MIVELYVFPQNNNERAVTRQMLQNMEVDAVEEVDGQEKKSKTKLDTDEKIGQVFPDGKWHKVVFKDRITGGDREKADAMQWKRDPITGNVVHVPYRYGKSWVLALLKSWDFTDPEDGEPLPTTEQGYDALCEDACAILETSVLENKDAIYPNLKTPLTIK